MTDYFDKTRIVEEVPGVPPDERFFLWKDHRVEAYFPSLEQARSYCAVHEIIVDEEERFEP